MSRWALRLGRVLGRDDDLPIDPDLDPADPAEPSPTHRPGVHLHRAHPAVITAIAVGGFGGTLARYALEARWPPDLASGRFPLTTFAVNTGGAFLLGFLLALILERLRPSRFLRPLLCVGFCGAFTTMSTLAVEAVTLVHDGHPAMAAGYLGATLAAGLAAAAVGVALGRVPGTRTGPEARA